MVERRKYTQTFKEESAELVISSERSIAEVAAEIGVLEGTLGRWVRKHKEADPERFATKEKEAVPWAEHQRALAENAKLKQEIEFLGKVSAFFAAKQR